MRCVGIDIAKKEYSAVALAVNGRPVAVATWKNQFAQDSEPLQITAFYNWVYMRIGLFRPDIVAVEELAVFMNKKVIRTLSRREGVAILAGKRQGAIVISPSVGSSRNIVLGIPANSSKEVAWEAVREMYPDFKFSRSNQGGMDQGDALVHALAAPVLIERR